MQNVLTVVTALAFTAMATVFLAIPFCFLWNAVVPEVCTLAAITYWQGYGLMLLVLLLCVPKVVLDRLL